MDYCIPCSRTLNGAVTCPECGAYDPGMAQLSDRTDGAPTVDAAVPKVRFSGRPDSSASPLPEAPTPQQDLPADRDDRPSRLRKYAVRSLGAAAFTILGGLAVASVLPEPTAPRAASIPERPSPEEPGVRVTDSSASPERVTTHPARKGVRDRNGDGIRRPLPTATRSKSPVSRPPTTSTPPSVKTKPTPRSSSSRRPSSPPQTATASARPSASPSGSISASPTSSGSPSSKGEVRG
ncbi:SCO2400 family protein [Streptomyces sp. HUAS TT20]|uniref:SCO2400 family protein n=1 Tax=Streptomyces sp. HUAS TT20 TaxID=3447509 RepID=UPI003F68A7E9